MAKLRVAPELLVQVLFSGADIEIRGASFDAQRRLIMLDIAGPEVPNTDEVQCLIHFVPESRTATFVPCGATNSQIAT